jgi:hypothetical protein
MQARLHENHRRIPLIIRHHAKVGVMVRDAKQAVDFIAGICCLARVELAEDLEKRHGLAVGDGGASRLDLENPLSEEEERVSGADELGVCIFF